METAMTDFVNACGVSDKKPYRLTTTAATTCFCGAETHIIRVVNKGFDETAK